MTTDNEKGPLNQMESGQEKRSASEARALSEIVNGTPSENLCRRGSPATEQASETTAQQPRTYTTQPAESVMGIALRQCGNEMEWRHILACNPEFARMLPHEYFPVGTVLNLPPHPAAASPVEQPEKSLAPEGGSEARGRWIQANCPTGDIIESPSPSNNREFPTSMSESDCEHRIVLAPSQPAAAPIEYRYEGGTHWCDLGPAERMRPDFKGVYRLKAGTFPVWAGEPAPSPADERAAFGEEWMLVKRARIEEIKRYTYPKFEESYQGRGLYDEDAVRRNANLGEEMLTNIQSELEWIDEDTKNFEAERAASATETGAEGADALAHEVWSAAQRAAFEWPLLPLLPETVITTADGEAVFTAHQMQGYANAYGEMVRARAASASATGAEGALIERLKLLLSGDAAFCKTIVARSAIEQAIAILSRPPAQADARVGLTDEQRKAIKWAARATSNLATREALMALLQGVNHAE
ncbi:MULTISPECIES: hypothetical protein [Burkholderia]|uniref:hypothetical protein n=1 Tax=Burkholderia TaxID=32008 RepID=UPI000876AB94|nr:MULTISPECIES: hypothetical protein [Burkholderia]TCT28570.1 hypothetical protein EC918_10836 [Burkholderia vietnamiensis]SCZ33061.1 hypothetical protein SAMN02787148_11036 [Burkholderia vietnamiensis]SFX92920.1 hypothetical protein SAMN02787160_11037 [Burkholderia vietnamiensis]